MGMSGIGGGFSRTLAEGLEGFRQQDKYFKAQASILAAWAVISIATIAIVAWSGRSENKLGADVRAEAAVGGTVLLITNTSTDAWTDITYTLNGLYLARQAELGPGDHASIPLKRFRKGGAAGKHAPRSLIPQTLAIRCDEGQFDTTLSVIAGGIAP
jgi:hypothetical protein